MYGRYKFDNGGTQRTLSSVANLYMKFSSTSDLFHELTSTSSSNDNDNGNGGNCKRSNIGDGNSNDNNNTNTSSIHPRSSFYSLIDNPLATSNNSTNTTPAKSPPPSSSSHKYNNNDNNRGESKGSDVVGSYSPLRAYEGNTDKDDDAKDNDDDGDDDDDDDDDDDEFDMSKMTTLEEASIFRGIDRLKIIYDILISKSEHCCKLDIRKLLKHKCIVALMPMHDLVDVYNLQLQWLTFFSPPWKQPNTLIRNYFGSFINLFVDVVVWS